MKPELYSIYRSIMTRFGDIYCAFEPPACSAAQIDELIAILEPGYILARGYDAYLDGHFIPGGDTHSGFCINERQIIHSVAEGVCSVHPIDFVKDTDRFIVLYPPYAEMDDRFAAIDRAIWHADANKTQYDFTFAEDGKFYCHEFTADCLAAADIVIAKTVKKFGVWPFAFTRQLYLAQNLIDACTIVYEFNPSATTPDLSSGAVADEGRPKGGFMFKLIKMIAMCKDIRAEVKAQGTLKNILLSRKFWGALWVLGAFYLDKTFNVTIDQNTQEMITNAIVVGASAAMVLFGSVMQLLSYYKTIKGLFKKP